MYTLLDLSGQHAFVLALLCLLVVLAGLWLNLVPRFQNPLGARINRVGTNFAAAILGHHPPPISIMTGRTGFRDANNNFHENGEHDIGHPNDGHRLANDLGNNDFKRAMTIGGGEGKGHNDSGRTGLHPADPRHHGTSNYGKPGRTLTLTAA